MSGLIKVDTAKVRQAAAQVKAHNDSIKNAFDEAEAAMRTIASHWDGAAAENARIAFFGIKNAYLDDRHRIMDDYINFMNIPVGEGYESAEKANTELAAAFK